MVSLYFVRSGYPYVGKGYLISAGIMGNYWSRSASVTGTAQRFSLDGLSVKPSGGSNNRIDGFSLRCLQE